MLFPTQFHEGVAALFREEESGVSRIAGCGSEVDAEGGGLEKGRAAILESVLFRDVAA